MWGPGSLKSGGKGWQPGHPGKGGVVVLCPEVGPLGGISVSHREIEFLVWETSAFTPKGSAWQRPPTPGAGAWAQSCRLWTRITSEKPLHSNAWTGVRPDGWALGPAKQTHETDHHSRVSCTLHPRKSRKGGRKSSGMSLPLSGTCTAEPPLPALLKKVDFVQGHQQSRFNPFPGI